MDDSTFTVHGSLHYRPTGDELINGGERGNTALTDWIWKSLASVPQLFTVEQMCFNADVSFLVCILSVFPARPIYALLYPKFSVY